MPAIIGHRGAAGLAPENTLAGLRAAAEAGARWVEFDVRLTADGQPVLFHDDDLGRTTDGSGPLAALSLAEVRTLDAGAWFAEGYRGEPIPTLDEAFAALDDLGLGANVEIKPDHLRQADTARVVVDRVRRGWPESLPPPVLSSFSAEAMAVVAGEAPELPSALLVDALPADWRQRVEALGCTAVHCAYRRLGRNPARALRDAGYAVRCYTVNRPRDAHRLFAWGVGSVFTDYPDRFA